MNGGNWTDSFLAVAIGLISFGIGMGLCFSDFRRVIVHPKAILTGLFGQLIVLPVIAFIIIFFWPIKPIYQVGFLLIAACPGGTMSNFVTYILRGRVPLSVSLTAFNSILILVSIPLIVQAGFLVFMGEGQSVNLGIKDTFSEILFSVILPVLGGITLNELTSDKFSRKAEKPIRFIITAILIAMVAVVLWFDDDQQSTKIMDKLHLMIPLVVLNLATILAGFYMAGYFGLKHKTRYTIGIEMGLQNSALAIYIANEVLDKPDLAMMAILYGGFSLFTTWGTAYILKRFVAREHTEQPQTAEAG